MPFFVVIENPLSFLKAILRRNKSVVVERLEIEQEKMKGLQAENAVLKERMRKMRIRLWN